MPFCARPSDQLPVLGGHSRALRSVTTALLTCSKAVHAVSHDQDYALQVATVAPPSRSSPVFLPVTQPAWVSALSSGEACSLCSAETLPSRVAALPPPNQQTFSTLKGQEAGLSKNAGNRRGSTTFLSSQQHWQSGTKLKSVAYYSKIKECFWCYSTEEQSVSKDKLQVTISLGRFFSKFLNVFILKPIFRTFKNRDQ